MTDERNERYNKACHTIGYLEQTLRYLESRYSLDPSDSEAVQRALDKAQDLFETNNRT